MLLNKLLLTFWLIWNHLIILRERAKPRSFFLFRIVLSTRCMHVSFPSGWCTTCWNNHLEKTKNWSCRARSYPDMSWKKQPQPYINLKRGSSFTSNDINERLVFLERCYHYFKEVVKATWTHWEINSNIVEVVDDVCKKVLKVCLRLVTKISEVPLNIPFNNHILFSYWPYCTEEQASCNILPHWRTYLQWYGLLAQ